MKKVLIMTVLSVFFIGCSPYKPNHEPPVSWGVNKAFHGKVLIGDQVCSNLSGQYKRNGVFDDPAHSVPYDYELKGDEYPILEHRSGIIRRIKKGIFVGLKAKIPKAYSYKIKAPDLTFDYTKILKVTMERQHFYIDTINQDDEIIRYDLSSGITCDQDGNVIFTYHKKFNDRNYISQDNKAKQNGGALISTENDVVKKAFEPAGDAEDRSYLKINFAKSRDGALIISKVTRWSSSGLRRRWVPTYGHWLHEQIAEK